jgi:pyrimidine operon attenuation protein/uracil phosphoribosyltransferase
LKGIVQQSPKELEENYYINSPNPDIEFDEIWLFDDVLRNGTHYRAAHNILTCHFPNVKIVGFFIARSVQHSLLSPF